MKRTLAFSLGILLLSGAGAFAAEPGVTDTEIKIGDVNILTGPASFIGRAVSLGSKIAAAEINAAGGVNGRKIVMATEDDGYVPSRSFQALKKLIEVDGIFALNGTSGTANVLAMMPLITDSNLPVVVTTAPNELVYTPVRPTVFTVGATYQDAFFAQLKYIHEKVQPANAVYGLIRQDDDFGVAIEEGYDRAIKQFKLKDAHPPEIQARPDQLRRRSRAAARCRRHRARQRRHHRRCCERAERGAQAQYGPEGGRSLERGHATVGQPVGACGLSLSRRRVRRAERCGEREVHRACEEVRDARMSSRPSIATPC